MFSFPLTSEQSAMGRFRRAYKRTYPWLNAGLELWLFIANVSYLFDKSSYYRPWLSWIGVDLRRLGADDLVCETQNDEVLRLIFPNSAG